MSTYHFKKLHIAKESNSWIILPKTSYQQNYSNYVKPVYIHCLPTGETLVNIGNGSGGVAKWHSVWHFK